MAAPADRDRIRPVCGTGRASEHRLSAVWTHAPRAVPGGQVSGGFGVGDFDDRVAVEGERGHRAERALAPTRIVEQVLTLRVAAGDHDGQLVADARGLQLFAGHGSGVPSCPEGQSHPCGDLDVRLAPRRAERVAEQRPVGRVGEQPPAARDGAALEAVLRLDQPLVERDGQAGQLGERHGGLLGAFQAAS